MSAAADASTAANARLNVKKAQMLQISGLVCNQHLCCCAYEESHDDLQDLQR